MTRTLRLSYRRSAILRVGALAAAILAMALPWAKGAEAAPDLTRKLLIEKGREVFLTAGGVGCASCHGAYAEGDVGIGPYNRGGGFAEIKAAIESVAAMEFLKDELSDAQMRQIAAYYEWLGEHKLVKTVAVRGRFVPNLVEIYPGTKIQLVVINASPGPHTFTSDDMGFGEIRVDGRENVAVVWEVPEQEGSFSLICSDCRPEGQDLTFLVTKEVEKFAPGDAAPAVFSRTPPARRKARRRRAGEPKPDRETIAEGRKLFLNAGEVGCRACHGRYAEGDIGIGPYNRGFSASAIRRALRSVDAMAFLNAELGKEQIKKIAAYYDHLALVQLLKTLVMRGLFVPEKVQIHPGTEIQLVVNNSSRAVRTFTSPDMGIEDFQVPGRDGVDIMWKAPAEEATFTLACADCGIKGQALVVEVTRQVPPYRPPVRLK